jgi:hypothetical protein
VDIECIVVFVCAYMHCLECMMLFYVFAYVCMYMVCSYVARLGSSCSTYYENSNNTDNNSNNNNKRSVTVHPQCYNPNTHDCINNITLCPKGYKSCGGKHITILYSIC